MATLAATPLRVCADPNNLPYSNHQQQGFENKIVDLIARDMGTQATYYWYPQRGKFFKQTLGSGVCDLVMSVPATMPGLAVRGGDAPDPGRDRMGDGVLDRVGEGGAVRGQMDPRDAASTREIEDALPATGWAEEHDRRARPRGSCEEQVGPRGIEVAVEDEHQRRADSRQGILRPLARERERWIELVRVEEEADEGRHHGVGGDDEDARSLRARTTVDVWHA